MFRTVFRSVGILLIAIVCLRVQVNGQAAIAHIAAARSVTDSSWQAYVTDGLSTAKKPITVTDTTRDATNTIVPESHAAFSWASYIDITQLTDAPALLATAMVMVVAVSGWRLASGDRKATKDWSPGEETCLRELVSQHGERNWKQKTQQLRARSWWSYLFGYTRSVNSCRAKWRHMRLLTARADMKDLENAIEKMVPRFEMRFHTAAQLDSFADQVDRKVTEFYESELEATTAYHLNEISKELRAAAKNTERCEQKVEVAKRAHNDKLIHMQLEECRAQENCNEEILQQMKNLLHEVCNVPQPPSLASNQPPAVTNTPAATTTPVATANTVNAANTAIAAPPAVTATPIATNTAITETLATTATPAAPTNTAASARGSTPVPPAPPPPPSPSPNVPEPEMSFQPSTPTPGTAELHKQIRSGIKLTPVRPAKTSNRDPLLPLCSPNSSFFVEKMREQLSARKQLCTRSDNSNDESFGSSD